MNKKIRIAFLISILLLICALPANAYVISDVHRQSTDNEPLVWMDSSFWNQFYSQGDDAISYSTEQWNNAGANFSFLYTSQYLSDNRIKYGYVAGGSPGVTQHDYLLYDWNTIESSTTILSNGYTWNFEGYMDQATYAADVKTVLIHELGHWLVLDHSNTSSSVMYSDWTKKWSLYSDDIAGIRAIWGTA